MWCIHADTTYLYDASIYKPAVILMEGLCSNSTVLAVALLVIPPFPATDKNITLKGYCDIRS